MFDLNKKVGFQSKKSDLLIILKITISISPVAKSVQHMLSLQVHWPSGTRQEPECYSKPTKAVWAQHLQVTDKNMLLLEMSQQPRAYNQ